MNNVGAIEFPEAVSLSDRNDRLSEMTSTVRQKKGQPKPAPCSRHQHGLRGVFRFVVRFERSILLADRLGNRA